MGVFSGGTPAAFGIEPCSTDTNQEIDAPEAGRGRKPGIVERFGKVIEIEPF
jgi:hypothetical protein